MKLEACSISAEIAEAGPFLQVLCEKDTAMAERFPKELMPGEALLPSIVDTHALGQRGHPVLTHHHLAATNRGTTIHFQCCPAPLALIPTLCPHGDG